MNERAGNTGGIILTE